MNELMLNLALIGDIDVGKTSLLLRFTDGTFTGEYVTNIGADYKFRTIESHGKSIKLAVWDTGAQERFLSLTDTIYRKAHGIFVVYDVTDEYSFSNVKDWLQEVDRYARSDVIKFLVGNKCDLIDKRVVEYTTAKAFADEQEISYVETSAKNDTNVEQAFMTMVAEIMREQGPYLTQPTICITSNSQPVRQGKMGGCC